MLDLPLPLVLGQCELVDEPLLADHDTLLVDDVVEFSVVLLEDLVFIVILVLVIVVLLLTREAALVVLLLVLFGSLAAALAMLVVQLVKDVLYLPLELLVH